MTHRVLVVEDERTTLKALQRWLEEHFDLSTAKNGEDALELIESEPPFDVIASDIVMPGISGFTLAERIYARSPESKVILFSANNVDMRRMRIVPNIKGFFEKPFELGQFSDSIQTLLYV